MENAYSSVIGARIVPRVFISFRFVEAMEQAQAIKQALEQSDINCFLCDVQAGENLATTVALNLHKAELVVILGTSTYGCETPSSFGTFQEMQYIMESRKPFFLIKMCEEYEEPLTKLLFPATISYYPWLDGPLSEDLVLRIIDKLESRQTRPLSTVTVIKRQWLSITRANGDKYEGECVNGAPNGKGKTIRVDKTSHEGLYVDAEPDGWGRDFTADGHLLYEGSYKAGQVHGEGKTFHRNGQVEFELTYDHGLPHGEARSFHANGSLAFDGAYEHGELHGLVMEWDVDGDMEFEGAYVHGELHGPVKKMQNGKMKFDGNYQHGQLHGPAKEYDPAGCLSFNGSYQQGKVDGPAKGFCRGRLTFDGAYQQGKKHGPAKEWDERGNLTFDGIYSDGCRYMGKSFYDEKSVMEEFYYGKVKQFSREGRITFEGKLDAYGNGEGRRFRFNGRSHFKDFEGTFRKNQPFDGENDDFVWKYGVQTVKDKKNW